MLYRLLGMAVWKAGKSLLRYRYGRAMVPRPVLVGLAGAVVAIVALGAARSKGNTGQLTP